MSLFSAEHWEQSSLYKLANCMMITSSMCPIQLFQTRFHCIADIRILILVEEHLKGNGDWNDFHANFTMDPDSQSPVSSSDTTLKNVWSFRQLFQISAGWFVRFIHLYQFWCFPNILMLESINPTSRVF